MLIIATAEHVTNLIKAHLSGDNEQFKTIILQIAAYEARHNHEVVARELKDYASKVGQMKNKVIPLRQLDSNLVLNTSVYKLKDLVVSEEILERIERILQEYKNKNKLNEYGLNNRRKILIEGEPGTGKTMTASVIAYELRLPLYVVQLDKIVTRFMGETSAKLRKVFDDMQINIGVYFFDEFDAIGADRNLDNEVGEMRRILNSFLQFIKMDATESLIIAATNHRKLLDNALFRRFDDVLHYKLPSEQEIYKLILQRFNIIFNDFYPSDEILKKALGLSHAEIIKACDDVIKKLILEGRKLKNADISTALNLIMALNERKDIYFTKEE